MVHFAKSANIPDINPANHGRAKIQSFNHFGLCTNADSLDWFSSLILNFSSSTVSSCGK